MASCPIDLEKWAEHYDFQDLAYIRDPYPVWSALREHCPVAHSDLNGGYWVPTRYEDIKRIAQDPVLFSSRDAHILMDDPDLPPITTDPPAHTRIRRILLPAFSPQAAARWEPATSLIAEDLIDGFVAEEQIDASYDYARQLPLRIFSRLLGIKVQDGDRFHAWITRMEDAANPEDQEAAFGEMGAYLHGTVLEHRDNPQDDLITTLIKVQADGESLSDRELVTTCFLLVLAGFDTTWSALSNTIHYLANHPEDRKRLVEALDEPEPSLWPLAVEEFLRAFANLSLVRRVTTEVKIEGRVFHENERVLLPFGAANHDPRVFKNPNNVQIDRTENRHLAFGAGIHRCLGSNLARMEVRVGLQTFLRRFPNFSIPEGAEVSFEGAHVRRADRLPLLIQPSIGSNR